MPKTTNRKSTKREADYRRAYKKAVPKAGVVGDGKDISAVKRNGINGIALVPESQNRSRTKAPINAENFVSLKELRKQM